MTSVLGHWVCHRIYCSYTLKQSKINIEIKELGYVITVLALVAKFFIAFTYNAVYVVTAEVNISILI